MPLWIEATNLADLAGGIGLGYGAHIRTDTGVYYEAHSLLFDLILGAGALGIIILTLALIRYGREFLTARDSALSLLALTLLVFSLTYSPMRNPLFWIALFLPFFWRNGDRPISVSTEK